MTNQERNREALIEHIADQDRIIRRRNDQIGGLVERITQAEVDLTKYRAMHSEQIKTIARLQENPRPLTADITDEMVERARWFNEHLSPETIREALTAALTEPTRPEGAEELDDHIAGMDINLMPETVYAYADFLAERGVRVVTEERS